MNLSKKSQILNCFQYLSTYTNLTLTFEIVNIHEEEIETLKPLDDQNYSTKIGPSAALGSNYKIVGVMRLSKNV